MIVHAEPRPHAPLFSPSSFVRAEACPQSISLSAELPPRAVGFATVFGSVSHEVLAWCLKSGRPPAEAEAVVLEGETIPVTDPMRRMVQLVLDYVRRHLRGRRLLVEVRLDSPWGRGLYGYADLVTGDAPWAVLDLKTGYGAPNWDQLALYGMWLILSRARSIEGEGEVRLIIIQPKATPPIQERVMTFAELRGLRGRLLDLLDKIRRRDWGPLNDGPWCRWCRAAACCPRLAAVARDAALADVAPASLVATGEFTAEELNRTLLMAEALEHRLRQAHALAREYVAAGGRLEDFKLVGKQRGGMTLAPRDDPRDEIEMQGAFQRALRSSAAADARAAAMRDGASAQKE